MKSLTVDIPKLGECDIDYGKNHFEDIGEITCNGSDLSLIH